MSALNGWVTTTLGDQIRFQRGFDITRKEQSAGDVPVVSSGGIASFHGEAAADGPGVVIGRKGALGTVHYVEGPYWPHDTTLWVTEFRGNQPRFVYYFLKQVDVSWLNVGSASPTLNRNHLHPLKVRWPGRDVQIAIAEVLGALDDKIAANDAVTRGADKLARALFAALPKDEVAPLSSMAQFVNGKAFTKNATGTGRVVVRIAELNSGIGGSTVYNDIEVPEQHLARPGDILFAWSGSLTLHRWYREEGIVNQHIFKVIPHEGRPPWLIWDLIANKLDEFRAIAADKATTMGHIQRRHLDEPVRTPTTEVIAQSNAKMTALWDRALAAERENLALTATRDALLPGLMSGKLRVRDAEGVLERLV